MVGGFGLDKETFPLFFPESLGVKEEELAGIL